jgi:hypothetical protein
MTGYQRLSDKLAAAFVAGLHPPYGAEEDPEQRSQAFAAMFMATIGEHLTRRDCRHLIAALSERTQSVPHQVGEPGASSPTDAEQPEDK